MADKASSVMSEGLSSNNSSASEVNKRLEDETWFHGFIQKEDLERMFHTDGDYAVRLSLDERAGLILNVQHKKQVKAFNIINNKKGMYYIEKREFESVSDLITYHFLAKVPVTETSGALLVRPINTQKWELDSDALIGREKLGGGEYGVVWKGMWKLKTAKEIPVAFKESLQRTAAAKLELLAEARTMLLVQTPNTHPNIVRCHGIAVKKDPIYLVLEYCSEGTLLQYLKTSNRKVPEPQKLKFCKEIGLALKHLEEKKCIHRDVAARNILLDKDRTVKLSDFGLALVGSQAVVKGKDKKIPIKWSAPEALVREEYSHKSDVWSFGVTVWEIYFNGDEPWPGKSMDAVRKELQAGKSMDPPKYAPSAVQDMVRKMWHTDPAKRPSPKQVKF